MAGTKVTYQLVADDAEAVRQAEAFIKTWEGGSKRIDAAMRGTKGTFSDLQGEITRGVLGGVTAYAALEKGVRLVTDAMREMNAERERGAQSALTSEMAVGQLAQLAKGPADMERMVAEAKRTEAEAGVDLTQAARLQFALESAGLAESRATFAQLFQLMQDPSQFAMGVKGTLEGIGREEAGTAREVVNKLFAASAESPATIEQFGPAMAQLSPSVKLMRGSDEEAMAALAMVAPAAGGSIDEAGTQLQAFAKAATERGLGGQGFVNAARQIQAMGMTDQQAIEFFGRMEAFKGFTNLVAQGEAIEGLTKRVAAAGEATREEGVSRDPKRVTEAGEATREEGVSRDPKRVTEAGAAPEGADWIEASLGARRAVLGREEAARKAAVRREAVTREELGPQQLGVRSAIDKMTAESIEAGEGPVERFAKRRVAGAAGAVGSMFGVGEEAAQAGFRLGGFTGGLSMIENQFTTLISALDRLTGSVDRKAGAGELAVQN